MSNRPQHARRWVILGVVQAVVATMFLVGVPSAEAVHDDGLFQLDYELSPPQGVANVSSTEISPAGNTGDDWDKVYAKTSGAFAASFIQDTYGLGETSFFTGGGSKDEELITGGTKHWEWDNANDVIPDKDDIVDAFAAAYDAPDGHVNIYFGADRYDVNGAAEMGFWFFREPVTLGTKPNFVGNHEIGDILVLVHFVQGGKIGEVNVYEWVGGSKPLDQILDETAADCSVAPAGDPVCGVINNLAGEDPPWDYLNKQGESTYRTGALFEAGIDFNELLGQDIGCFSSFMAETRSSHSVDAQLKDFALGAFPVCGIKVTKTGDALSKIGDPVDYTITIENTGRATLYKRNISDTLLGAITTNGIDQSNPYVLTNTCGATLAAGATCTITLQRTVEAGDPDPLPNTVSILYSEHSDFTGLEFTSTDDWSVNLFQPAVEIAKTGDELSKVGDAVKYTFTITNKSSEDSPDLELASISDNVLGDLSSKATAAGCDVLTYNEVCSFDVTRTVLAADLDPLVNTVDVLYHPDGFPNDVTASDGHSVNLFQPDVSIEKTGDALSKIGDKVTYHFKITNTSSADSPDLVLDSISDDLLGDLETEATAAGCDNLAPAAFCEFDKAWTVAAVDIHPADGKADDPVINTVTVHFHPDGFPNDITATSTWETDLLHPSFKVTKVCKAEPVSQAGPAVFTITFDNTGDADLHVVPSEGAPFNVAAGQSSSYDYSVAGPFSATVDNTVTGDVTLAAKYGLSNSYPFTASGSCTVKGKVKVVKTVSGQPPAAGQTFTFELRQGASTISDGTILETQTTDAAGQISFATELDPGQTYQLCEWVMPGWNTSLGTYGTLFVPNSITPPNLPNPNVNNMTVCVDFTVASGETKTFNVDNSPPPGGRALTIGFWKNWASCASSKGKGQDPVLDQTLAAANVIGDSTDGHSTLPGIVVSATSGSWWQFGGTYYLVIHGSTATPDAAPDCQKAVRILNKSRIGDGKKMASDPAFNLAAQLLGAELNLVAGAYVNGTVITAINNSVLLLGKYHFDGNTHTPISKADAAKMNCYAGQLDDYNNNRTIRSC